MSISITTIKNKKGNFQTEIRKSGILIIVTKKGCGIWKNGNWHSSAKNDFHEKTKNYDISLSMNDTMVMNIEDLEELLTVAKTELGKL